MKTAIIVVLSIIEVLSVVIVLCCCAVSGRCAEAEERLAQILGR